MKAKVILIALLLALCTGAVFAQQSANEVAVWKLEHSYWEYVKAADLVGYRTLWDAKFVGWPYISPAPQRKDHVTDWLRQYTGKGVRLASYSLEPLGSVATGNIVVTYYRLTAVWGDQGGNGKPQTSRITHTWIRTPAGWQILGGMSAHQPEDQR
ncbi:nuclear transport factor 2 family protein [Edaphobacter acidisoli]|uniref:nuclear transport factor 2 family protein n=1 Tax=Edaphobacter acidisoli TaxID=2040573 RepID=UPI00166E70D5|nr:nuclear transport factor 2 family protein [Edaphobacter acidisoli]